MEDAGEARREEEREAGDNGLGRHFVRGFFFGLSRNRHRDRYSTDCFEGFCIDPDRVQ